MSGIPADGPERAQFITTLVAKTGTELGSMTLGSRGAAKQTIFNASCQVIFRPGVVPTREDKRALSQSIDLGPVGHEVRSFNKYWAEFLRENPRFDPNAPEYSPGGRRSAKPLQSIACRAMSTKTVRASNRMARKMAGLALAAEEVAAESLMQAQPGAFTHKEVRKFTNGTRLHMLAQDKGGRTILRGQAFNGEKAVREKRDAY